LRKTVGKGYLERAVSMKHLEAALQKITKKSTYFENSALVLLSQKEILATLNIYKNNNILAIFRSVILSSK